MRRLETIVFPGITPKRMELIRARAKMQGLVLDGAKGTATWDHGIGVDWSYDENKEIFSAAAAIPFGVSENEVEGALSSIVRRSNTGYPADDVRPDTRDVRVARAELVEDERERTGYDPNLIRANVDASEQARSVNERNLIKSQEEATREEPAVV